MALNHNDTDVQTLKINSFATLADYQAAYGQGLIDSSEISFIDEPLQADWNQTIGTAPDFIRNKPSIPTPTAADAGKVLTVSTAGAFVLELVANAEQTQY